MVEELCKKNLTKISCLFALKLRILAGQPWITAGELAELAGVNRDSLYTLLRRWHRWEYIRTNKETNPRTYCLANGGKRYLDRLGRWYPYQGEVFKSIMEYCIPSFYWQMTDRDRGTVTRICFIQYPFQSSGDFHSVYPDISGRLIYQGNSQIRIKKANCLTALYAIRDVLGLHWGEGLVNKLIEEKFISRN